MDIQKVPPDRPVRQSLHLELETKALRHSVWLAVYHSQQLQLHGLTHALTRTLRDIDRMLVELDAA